MERQLILHVRGLIKPFIVIDAEGKSRLPHGSACSRHLWRKETSRHR